MRTIHLVQPSSTGRTKFITLELDGATLSRTWGLIGCKTQRTENTYDYINKGKSNELTPEQAAEADFDRLVRKKTREGYRESKNLEQGSKVAVLDTIDFDNPPRSFAPSKPIKKISDSALNRLIKKNSVVFPVKEDGLCHWIFINSAGEPVIYTRRMDDHTRKYPGVVKAVKELGLPPKTVLAVELVVDPLLDLDHTMRFNKMQSISKSDVCGGKVKEDISKTLRRQAETPVRAMVFHIMYYDEKKIWKEPYRVILELIGKTFKPIDSGDVLYAPNMKGPFKNADEVRAYVNDNKTKIEGLVAWDLDAAIEVDFRGKPKRKACYKIKARLETDVIAYDFEEGSGENQGRIGALLIGAYKNGELVKLGKVGTGLKDHQRDIKDWTFPCVVQIEYSERFPSGPFQFPVFVKEHEDQDPSRCVVN